MERLPPTEFGRALRRLVRERWKTQGCFAEAIGMDETWVSTIIRDRQKHLSYASLQALLSGFGSPCDKDELYEAWRVSYAPGPSHEEVPNVWSSDEQILDYALDVHGQISRGKVLVAFKTLGGLWQGLKGDPKRYYAALTTGSSYVEAAHQLGRIPLALHVCEELSGLVRPRMEPAGMARVLWLRGVSLRNERPRDVDASEAAFTQLARHLRDWQPRSPEEQGVHREFTQIVLRDAALSALDLVKAGHAPKDVLVKRVEALKDAATELEDETWIGLASEVAGRALIAAGKPDDATGQLNLAARYAATKVNQLKVLISQIQLLMATGSLTEAEEKLMNALDIADQYSLVHHRLKLATIERQLRAHPSARVFPMG